MIVKRKGLCFQVLGQPPFIHCYNACLLCKDYSGRAGLRTYHFSKSSTVALDLSFIEAKVEEGRRVNWNVTSFADIFLEVPF